MRQLVLLSGLVIFCGSACCTHADDAMKLIDSAAVSASKDQQKQVDIAANRWLMKMSRALRERDYQGRLVYVADGRIETLQVFHAFVDGRERERMVTLSGPSREIVRDEQGVMCIGTDDSPVVYTKDRSRRWSPALEVARAAQTQFYSARVVAQGRAAGLPAAVLEVRSEDPWRYGYRLWLESDSGLPLRLDLINSAGRAMEKLAFTEIALNQRPSDENLRASLTSLNVSTRTTNSIDSPEPDPGWRAANPPPGYVLRSARRRGEVVQLLYSDGLANVSVYIEPVRANQSGESTTMRGALNAHARWKDGWRVLAIGKVPAETVAQFAQADAIAAKAKPAPSSPKQTINYPDNG